MTFEQKAVCLLTYLLFFFNNPWYLVQVQRPKTKTFVASGIQTALFVAALMIFWLKDLAKFQPKESDLRANPVSKLTRKSLGNKPFVLTMLGIFFAILVIDFVGL